MHETRTGSKDKLTIIIISGKNPLTSSGGYASYAKSFAVVASSLGHDIEIICVGDKTQITRTPFGTIRQIGIPFLFIIRGFEMAGLLPLSFVISWHILIQQEARSLIWGIGPWSLAAALVKKIRPNEILVADYFTTIKHEWSGMRSSPLSIALKLKIASILIIPLYSFLERFLLRSANHIVTHYRSTQTILSGEFDLEKSRFIHLPYEIHTLARTKSLSTKNSRIPIIVTVTRHDPRKGIADLLAAYQLLSKRGIIFGAVIIGDGMLFDLHRRLVQKLGLARIVSLVARVKDVTPYLNGATLFVLPSHEEGSSSLAVLEAMSRGIAVIATNVDGIPEDIEDGKSGILIPPANPEVLSQAIFALIRNPQKRRVLGKNAQKRYRDLHVRGVRASLSAFFDTFR